MSPDNIPTDLLRDRPELDSAAVGYALDMWARWGA